MVQHQSSILRSRFLIFPSFVSVLSCVLFLVICFLFMSATSNTIWATDRYAPHVTKMVKVLGQDKDAKKRREAARSLGYHNTPQSLAALASALTGDKDYKVRQAAASSLWKHSPKIEPAKNALVQSLSDPHPGVAIRASWALQNSGVKAQELTTPRLRALSHPKSTVSTKFWAAYGLVGHAPPTQLVEHLLNYSKSLIRAKEANNAFKRLVSQKDREVIPPMLKMVEKYHKGNVIVLRSLQTFQPQPKKLVDLLCRQFDFPDMELRAEIIGLLRNQGKKEEEVRQWLPKVRPYLLGHDSFARTMAIGAVSRAEGLAADAVPDLVTLMKSATDASVRERAASAVGDIGDRNKVYPDQVKETVAKQAMDQLLVMMRSEPKRSTRMTAVRTLDKLKTEPADVVPAFLAVVLKDKDSLVRTAAMSALGARGADAQSAVADLEKLAGHTDRALSISAQSALTMISRDSNSAAETLESTEKVGAGAQKNAMAVLRSSNARFDENGFMLALSQNKLEKVKAYLDAGVSVNYKFEGSHDQPALNHVFARSTAYGMRGKGTPQQLKDVVRLMLDRGADPNLVDKMGNTALMKAAMGCDGETLAMLLDAGADLNTKNKAGLTALEFAFMLANKGADVLLKRGARISQDKVDNYVKVYGRNPEAVKLIQRAGGP